MLKEALKSMDSHPEPGSIEYARLCKKRHKESKQEARQKQLEVCEAVAIVATDSDRSSIMALPAKSLEFLKLYGSLEAIVSVGNALHQELVVALGRCHQQGFVGQIDDLVQHQLQDSMSTTSAKKLGQQLKVSDVGSRILSIGSFLLVFSCALLSVQSILLCF